MVIGKHDRPARPSEAERKFSHFAGLMARASGQPAAFLGSILIVLIWAACGPAFHYSDTWQLVINTGTTIITFLMVFLIQNTQNRDALAVQVKLDELVRALETANNKFVGIESKTEQEVEALRQEVQQGTSAVSE
jgi:low affinity Fe/Cu permease